MLTQTQIDNALPSDKPYKLHDQHGLYLLVSPTGVKSWRYQFQFPRTAAGKHYTLTYGRYKSGDGLAVDLTLSEARAKHHEARVMLKEGKNPARPLEIEESYFEEENDA